ncbi:MAG: agmatinase [Deltaproteobacteria bacterium]|nr:agmatinase [Deltaproteobacteria bacterium]
MDNIDCRCNSYPLTFDDTAMSHAPIANNFLGLESQYSTYEKSKVVILPAPFEASTSYQTGTADGPKAILEASQQVEVYDIELGTHFHTVGIHTTPSLNFSGKTAEQSCQLLYEKTKKVLSDKKWPVMLGGEHTISYGLFQALFEKYPNLSLFHIDAHADMREAYEGNPYSHASILYLIRKTCPRTVSIGIRSICEFDTQTQKTGFDTNDLFSHLTEDVYLTIDVDGFSPSLIPSTGTPEPGGLGWYETLDILKKLFKKKNVVGMDFVEMMPIKNVVYGDFSVAKMIYKCIGYNYFQ